MKQPFTFQEHLVVGAQLSRLQDEVMQLEFAVHDAYGLRLSGKLRSIEKAIGKLKSAMDSQICGEHPLSVSGFHGIPLTRVYYRWQDGPSREMGESWSPKLMRDRLRCSAATILDGNPWPDDSDPAYLGRMA